MSWVALRSKPLSYHLRKLRTGYAVLEDEQGKLTALSPSQRTFVGRLSRLVNLPKYLRRRAMARAAMRAAPAAPPMADGYVKLPAVVGHARIIEVCEAQFRIYEEYLAEGRPALLRRGIDPEAYEREIEKTADDPLKHVPCHYDPAVIARMLDFALQPQLVATAARYLGVLPVLASLRILYSPNADAALANAQRFHLDPEGARQAKGFMAVRRVGPTNSPLTFVPAEATARMLASGNEIYEAKRVPDKYIVRGAHPSTWVEHMGEPGDALLVDTSRCFHFGSRPNKDLRLLFYFSYLDPLSSFFPVLDRAAGKVTAWRGYKGDSSPNTDFILGRRL